MKLVVDVPEKYYKDAKRMVWSSTYSGSLISGWLRNGIPVKENGGHFVTDDYTANMRTTQDNCISMEAVIEWLKDQDIIKMKWQEENARKELAKLPAVQPEPIECEERENGNCPFYAS